MDLQIDAFTRTLAEQRAAVLADPQLCRGLLQVSGTRHDGQNTAQAVGIAWESQLANAAATLRMIEPYVTPAAALLEIGGGLGLTYAWLRRLGFAITSLEPGMAGHGGSFAFGQRLLAKLGVDSRSFLPLPAEAAPSLGHRFGLIFSYNVLEHLRDLPGALTAMAQCLAPGGVMRHGCPNYRVPYEPHFGLLLPPLYPRALGLLVPSLQRDELWRGLNFVAAPDLQRWAGRHGLRVRFDRGHTYQTFERLETEPSFAEKHPGLYRLSRLLRRSGLLPLLRHVPPTWMTPMQVTFSSPDAV